MTTANLQRLTIRQLAAAFNVSERSIYMAGELLRTGRSDLNEAVEAGRMTLLAALREAKPEKYGKKASDNFKTLQKAWLKASRDERILFRAWLEEDGP
jgi:hypothetical protein